MQKKGMATLLLLGVGGWVLWKANVWSPQSSPSAPQIREGKERMKDHAPSLEVDFRMDTEARHKEENAHPLRVRDLGGAEGEDRLEKLGSPLIQGKVPSGWRVEADASESVEWEHAKMRVRSPVYRLNVDSRSGYYFFSEPGVADGMGMAPLLLADAAMLRTHAKRLESILIQMREVMPPDGALPFQGKTEGQEKGDDESRRNRSESNR